MVAASVFQNKESVMDTTDEVFQQKYHPKLFVDRNREMHLVREKINQVRTDSRSAVINFWGIKSVVKLG